MKCKLCKVKIDDIRYIRTYLVCEDCYYVLWKDNNKRFKKGIDIFKTTDTI